MRPSSFDLGSEPESDADVDALIERADAARAADDIVNGVEAAERAWAATAADDAPRRLRAGLLQVYFQFRSRQLDRVIDCGLQILPLQRVFGASTVLVELLRSIALAACETQRFDLALASAKEAHGHALQVGDLGAQSLALNALACTYERLGDPWQAERLFQDALALARSQPLERPVVMALNNLSVCLVGKYFMLRDALPLEQAREPLCQALPHIVEAAASRWTQTDLMQQVFTLSNLGEVHVHLGTADAAEAALNQALALALQHGMQTSTWRVRCSLGELLLLRGEPRAAQQALTALAGEPLHPPVAMRLQHALWRCAEALDEAATALVHLRQYLQQERLRTLGQFRAQSELFVTRAEAEVFQREARHQQQRSMALEVDASCDQLTGLANRRELERRWPVLIEEARDAGTPLSVAMFDLDHFKQVNDRHGHAVGDRVLVVLAELLRASTRGSDLAVRLGGEEFLLLLPQTAEPAAAEVCERLRQRVAAYPWAGVADGLQVTISGGLCGAPTVAFESLRQQADEALYRAKREGRNRLVQISPVDVVPGPPGIDPVARRAYPSTDGFARHKV